MRAPKNSFICLVIAAVIILLTFTPLGVSAAVSPERISIACSKDIAPFHFMDDNGQPAGIMVDTWRLWSEKTGIPVGFQIADWNETLTMVGSGKADVHAGLFFNKERDTYLDYGLEFMKMETHLFRHVSLPPIKTIIDAAPYHIGVIAGDYLESYLKERNLGSNVVPFNNYGAMMNALRHGTIKVFAADTLPGLFYLDKNGLISSFTFNSEKPLYQNSLFFAVKEGNQTLIEKINQGMVLITDEEKRDINRRWITISDDNGEALIISIDRAYAPLTFINAIGRPSGLFVDMWRAWAHKTGKQIEFRTSNWAGTLEALRTGEVDIHSGLSFSKERERHFDLSKQIYETFTRIYHRFGDIQPESISGYNPYVVGTEAGSHQDAEFRKEYPFASIRLRTFGTNQELIDALLRGEVKAILQEEVTMEADLDQLGLHSDITSRPERLFPSTIHAGVLKGNAELLDEINKGFAAIDRTKLVDIEQRWIPNPEDRFYVSDTASMDLSPAEALWLDNQSEIRVGVMDAWPPMNFVDGKGSPQGLGVDYLNALNKRLSGVLTIVPGSFKENFDLVKNKKLDALMDITPKEERESFFNFTAPYLTIPHVIVGRTGESNFSSEKDIEGKTVALERGFYNVKYFRNNFPKITVKEYVNTSEALEAVSRGEADAYAGNRAVVTYLIEKELIANLSIQGRMEKPPVVLTIGVRKDWPLLAELLDRAFESIPQRELRKINRKWLGEIKGTEASVELTPKEVDWIKQHPVVRVAMDPDWAPVEFADDKGRFHGISMDYLQELSGLLDIQFEASEGLTWQEAVTAVDNGELDMFSSVARTPEREAKYYFTNPYLSMPINIFSVEDVAYVGSLDALKEKQVAVVEGYAIHEWLQTQHPEIKLLPVKSIPTALKMVATGQAYAFVGNVVTTSYYIGKLRLNQIRVVGETPYKYAQSMAVRQDWPILAGILQKGLDAIPQSEREITFNRWVSIKYEHGFDYSLLWKIMIPVFLVILMVIYWNRRLSKEVIERKTAELKFRAMSDASHDAMIMINAQDEVMFWNSAAEVMFGYSSEEARGSRMHNLFVPDDLREAAANGLKRFAATGEGPVIGNVIENEALHRGGHSFPVEIAVSSFQLGDGWYAVGSVRDITERRTAERALKKNEAKYRELVENANSIIIKLDPEGRVTFFNEYAQSFFGYTQEEVLGHSIVDSIVPEEDAEGQNMTDLIKDIIRHPENYEKNENENIRKNGERVWVSWTNKAVFDDDEQTFVELLCIGTDITERRKAEIERDQAFAVITSSINYASRIQRAVLPPMDLLKEATREFFIVWEPRDVVGGDIYWCHDWGRGIVIILADCTGHGVPGAFMTLISSGALDLALLELPEGDSAGLISKMHQLIQIVLSQDREESEADDGLELGVCYIPPDKKELIFAGAGFPLFISEDGKVTMIKGDRKGIGYRGIPLDMTWTNKILEVEQGMCFYMSSDGIFDQIGGPKRRGFGKKRFMKLLNTVQAVPFVKQGDAIYQQFIAYQGEEKRRDDVSVIGFNVRGS